MTSVAAAASASADWLSTADRLALLIQRFAIAEEKVAQQLGWPLEQLRAYLSPEARRQQAASDVCSVAPALWAPYWRTQLTFTRVWIVRRSPTRQWTSC